MRDRAHVCLVDAHAERIRRDDDLGAVAPGMLADLALVDMHAVAFTPLNDVREQLVHCEDGRDVVLTMVAGSAGRGGLTKSLAVRYRKPTPLDTPLVYTGEVEAEEERVTRIVGRLMAGDVVCAEATGEVVYRAPAPA